jgi:hypothetical protein
MALTGSAAGVGDVDSERRRPADAPRPRSHPAPGSYAEAGLGEPIGRACLDGASALYPAGHRPQTPCPCVFCAEAGSEGDMGVLRGLFTAVGGLLAGVFGLLRGVFEGVGRLFRRLV